MARLPIPGSDNGTWGDILNEYLSQTLKSDGSLKDNSVTSSSLAPNSVTNTALASNAVNATIIADGSITEALLDSALQTKINSGGGGSVTSVAGKTGVVTLDKSDVNLDQVDNTSDATKNSAAATLTNKTLTDPQLSGAILDTNGNKLIHSSSWSPSAVNHLGVETSPLGSAYVQLNALGDDTDISLSLKPAGAGEVQIFKATGSVATLLGNGLSADIDLNLRTKGSGVVKANNIEIATVSGAQTLTNKTLTDPIINGDVTVSGDRPFLTSNHTGSVGFAGGMKWQQSGSTRLEMFYDSNSEALNLWNTNGTNTGTHFSYNREGFMYLGSGSSFDPSIRLKVYDDYSTATTGEIKGILSEAYANPVASATTRVWGLQFVGGTKPGNTQNLTDNNSIQGIEGKAQHNGTGTVTGASGGLIYVENTSTGTITNARTLNLFPMANGGGGNITNAYHVTTNGLPDFTANNQSRIAIDVDASMPDPGVFTGTTAAAIRLNGGNGVRDGILFSNDTTLYRSAADTLKTDDNFIVGTPGTSSGSVATIDGTQTLSNKTLTDPKISMIRDSNGNAALFLYSHADAVSYIEINNSPISFGPSIRVEGSATAASLSLYSKGSESINLYSGNDNMLFQAYEDSPDAVNFVFARSMATGNGAILGTWGTDTDVDLNLVAKGNGIVKANGVEVATIANVTRLVCTTVFGGNGAENGPNTWAKIATFSTGTNQYAECQLVLSVTGGASGNHDTAIISVYFRVNTTGTNPDIDVKILSKGGAGFLIASDSFKVISGGWSTDMELWIKKAGPYGMFNFYETSRYVDTGTLTYTTNPTWQSATPTGAVNNVSSDGITAFGVQIADVSSTQTLTNKILTNPKISSIKDANGNTSLTLGTISNAVNNVYIDNQPTGSGPTIGAAGSDTNIDLALQTKGTGVLYVLRGNGHSTIQAGGGYNGGNVNLELNSQGTGVVRANNKPVMTSQMMYPFYTDPNRFEPWPQMFCAGGNWSLTSGDMPMTLFTPSVDMTVSNIITMGWNDTTQTGATACRVAIFRVDDLNTWPANMTCIARSAHKADRWNGAVLDTAPIVDDGTASPNPISSINLTAGQQYAVSYMSVGHTGTPKLSALGVFRKGALKPHLSFFGGGGYTDIPVNLTDGWIEEWTHIWFALT